ncbi:hypothetical protein E4U55_001986 [Claviceps digitariae]|nr:hypothetical protein E4U55_001986 [Claviceps digitariae]
MGQEWVIAAFGRKAVMPRFRRTLGKLLFDKEVARSLELALAVPITPTHLDFQVKNVRAQSDAACGNSSICSVEIAAKVLIRMSVSVVDPINTMVQGISKLPVELHILIFDYCVDEDLAGVIALGLTNQYFWSIARTYVMKHVMANLGAWAGQQLIAVGDSVRVDDHPPDLFATKKAEHDLLSRRQDDYIGGAQSPTDGGDKVTLYDRIVKNFRHEQLLVLPTLWLDLCSKWLQPRHLTEDTGVKAFRRMFSTTTDDFYPPDQVWMLRNLTTNEYVRGDGLALEPQMTRGPFIRGIGFGIVLLSRILWSSDPSVSLKEPTGTIHRGVWAGHRFDITTTTRHEEERADGQVWTDVTAKLLEEVMAIFEMNVGKAWKDFALCRHTVGLNDGSRLYFERSMW